MNKLKLGYHTNLIDATINRRIQLIKSFAIFCNVFAQFVLITVPTRLHSLFTTYSRSLGNRIQTRLLHFGPDDLPAVPVFSRDCRAIMMITRADLVISSRSIRWHFLCLFTTFCLPGKSISAYGIALYS